MKKPDHRIGILVSMIALSLSIVVFVLQLLPMNTTLEVTYPQHITEQVDSLKVRLDMLECEHKYTEYNKVYDLKYVTTITTPDTSYTYVIQRYTKKCQLCGYIKKIDFNEYYTHRIAKATKNKVDLQREYDNLKTWSSK